MSIDEQISKCKESLAAYVRKFGAEPPASAFFLADSFDYEKRMLDEAVASGVPLADPEDSLPKHCLL